MDGSCASAVIVVSNLVRGNIRISVSGIILVGTFGHIKKKTFQVLGIDIYLLDRTNSRKPAMTESRLGSGL